MVGGYDVCGDRAGDDMKSILDPGFKYTNAAETDLRKTFARIRKAQAAAVAKKALIDAEAADKVTQIPTTKRAK